MLKVLIVDDDITVIHCFEQLIDWKRLGYDEIYTASNGERALEIALREDVDVVISDLKMPIMGGVELAHKLRINNSTAEIILLTAYENFDAARKGIELKIYDYILKPIVMKTIERLSLDLMNIAKMRTTISWVDSFIKDEFDSDIRMAFQTHNMQYFRELFDKMESLGNEGENNQLYHLFVVKLIGVLCAYLKELDFSDESVKYNREKLLKLVKTVDERKEINHLLWEKISSIVEATRQMATDSIRKSTLAEIKEYIQCNYMRYNFCVGDIAKAFHYSPDHINRIFKSSEGITASQCIINLKMEKAKELILSSDMAVGEVARAVGYNSLSHFANSFKKKFGISPSALRERNRNIEYCAGIEQPE